MDRRNCVFLSCLRAAVGGAPVEERPNLTAGDWSAIFQMAQAHHVLPMVYEAARTQSVLAQAPFMASLKRSVMQQVALQTVKTNEFLELYAHLRSRGLKPLVVKGLVCRNLYPRPDHRISGDEDLLIPRAQAAACMQAMESWGMVTGAAEGEKQQSCEVPYTKPGSPLYIELHKSLFPPESEAYGDLNGFFAGAHTNAIWLKVENAQIKTLGHSDHLFYLICHAFKHFLHSGFGLRQVCDITLYANAYGSMVDWQRLLEQCTRIRAERFAAAIFAIGGKYLTFDRALACYPRIWQEVSVDEGPMLEDLLDAGIYGDGSMSRKHSANMTLSAVAAQKQGRKANGVLRSLFPDAAYLQGRYTYLKKQPWLLPVAWTDRLVRYGFEAGTRKDDQASVSLKLGSRRIALMKQYGIID